jgi:hypothetical protein
MTNFENNKRKDTKQIELKTKRQEFIEDINDFFNENKDAKEEFINDIIYFLNPYYVDVILFKKNLEKKNLLEKYINIVLESFNFYILEEIKNSIENEEDRISNKNEEEER